ncbi:hypothetical protein LIER_43317 [Lithospermum erythrorhizon]|uniref:Myb/SANT-like domain-containing protein n=1 Tax=Lithospermum erythrorhizon TaxID=34254 RepID=A0AAV3PUM5_LITER
MDRKNIYNIIEKKVAGPKRKASQISQTSHLARSESAPPSIFLPKREVKRTRSYLTWTKGMDNALGIVLMDQLAQGNKCDSDGWKPQALQAAMQHLNSSLGLNLSKENIKNRLRAWKKCHGRARNIQFEKSGFHWDEERKMIVITHAELLARTAYVKV